MTNQEWESRMDQLQRSIQQVSDQQLVTQRLLETYEQRWERRFDQIAGVVDQIAGAVNQIADAQRTTEATLASLITQIDRFLQGRSGNGNH